MGLWHKYAGIAYLAVFFGVTGHASSEFVSVLSGMAGPELSVWRFLLGGAGLVVLAILLPSSRNLLEPFKTHGLHLVGLSLMGATLAYLMFHWSLDFATVPQVATMVTTVPIFVGLINLRLNHQPFTGAKIITGLSAVLGVALLITDGYLLKLAGSGQNLLGVLMAMMCAACVGTYAVTIRPIIARYGALRITAVTMMIGAAGLWLVVGVFWGIWVNPATFFDRSSSQIASLLTIGIWNTTITQYLWIGGLAAVPDITRGSYLFFLKPVIAAFLAVLFLSQALTLLEGLAIAVICSSVVVEALWGWLRRDGTR